MKVHEADDILRALRIMKPSQRRAFFQMSTPGQIRLLEEIFLNLLKNPKGLTKSHLATAKKYSGRIQRLADCGVTPQTKRKILQQRGGFLAALLPILGTLVASFIQ